MTVQRKARVTRLRKLTRRMALLGLASALCLSACGHDDGTHPETPGTALEQAWQAFEDGDLRTARGGFQVLVAADSSDGEAWNGLGWTLLRGGVADSARIDFLRARTLSLARPAEALAGEALAGRAALPFEFEFARRAAEEALTLSPDFVFSHDPNVDARDLRMVLAQCLFGLGLYADASEQVRLLGGSIDPGSPTFVEDLLREIARLGESD